MKNSYILFVRCAKIEVLLSVISRQKVLQLLLLQDIFGGIIKLIDHLEEPVNADGDIRTAMKHITIRHQLSLEQLLITFIILDC